MGVEGLELLLQNFISSGDTPHEPKKSAIKNLKPLIYRWFEVFID
jgi:hypothetical protein